MRRMDYYSDKITGSVEEATTGKKFDTQVQLLKLPDLKKIAKTHGWRFNWKLESKNKFFS